jgi:2-dehydro-3-deoxyphosphogluconate aldolase / (4S)-4-hydroxy-2-oxoglutarate aldolase
VIEDILARAVVIPVLTLDDPELAAGVARALWAGGIEVAEVTLRTPGALTAARAMKAAAPGMSVGVGTVLTPADVSLAAAAGADFLVSPGCTPRLADALLASRLPALPGASTATEVMALLERGFRAQKFFPAQAAGGVAAVRALAGPLPQVRFCPTGGIGADQAAEWLALPNVACVGGSWLAPDAAVAARDWATIEANARRASALRSTPLG